MTTEWLKLKLSDKLVYYSSQTCFPPFSTEYIGIQMKQKELTET